MKRHRDWRNLAFHLLYHQLAWTYDWVSAIVSRGQWTTWQRTALPYLIGPRILELGHGPGHLLADLSDLGYEMIGLDLSPAMGRLAQRSAVIRHQSAKLVRGCAQHLPFADQLFDSILATFPTTYILAPATIVGCHRVLRPGGRLVIVPEAQLTGDDLLSRGLEWLYTFTGQRHPRSGNWAEQTEYWQNALSGPGFWVEVRHKTLPNSVVTVVIAERKSDYEPVWPRPDALGTMKP